MKIALSASFYNIEAVQDVLRTCDRIYSPHLQYIDEIIDIFGVNKVRGLPDGQETTLAWIIAKEQREADPGVEIEFLKVGDLLKIANATDACAAVLSDQLASAKRLIEEQGKTIARLQEDQRRPDRLASTAATMLKTWPPADVFPTHHSIDDRYIGGCETRDPMDQDHSAIPAGAIAQDYRGENI